MKSTTEKILREYIRDVITEWSDGDITGEPEISIGEKGYFSGFKRLFHTVVGKSKEMLQQVKTAVRVSLEAVGSIVVPFASAEYDKIFEESGKKIEAIKSDYKEVYEETAKHLNNSDVAALAFMVSPATVITSKFLNTAPDVAVDAVDVVTGGTMTDYLSKIKDATKAAVKTASVASIASHAKLESRRRAQGHLFEEKNEKKEDGNQKLKKALASPEMIKKINENPRVKKMRVQAKKIVDEETAQILDSIQNMLAVKSIQDVEKLTGKQIPQGKELQQLAKKGKVPDQKIDQAQFASIKKMIKEFFVKKLVQKTTSLKRAGIPENNYVHAKYNETIKKIQAL